VSLRLACTTSWNPVSKKREERMEREGWQVGMNRGKKGRMGEKGSKGRTYTDISPMMIYKTHEKMSNMINHQKILDQK
jgi:hypothetical protein